VICNGDSPRTTNAARGLEGEVGRTTTLLPYAAGALTARTSTAAASACLGTGRASQRRVWPLLRDAGEYYRSHTSLSQKCTVLSAYELIQVRIVKSHVVPLR